MARSKTQSDQAGAERKIPNINWDDSKMVSTYANVCNVASTKEEVTLLFGTSQVWRSQQEVTVQLSNRMILNPHAAKRLSVLLTNVIAQYEQRFGELALMDNVPEAVKQ